MTEPKPPNYDRTARERVARQRARGRQISCVLTDPDAIAALDRLIDRHGTQRAAIEAVLAATRSADPNY